jgi:rhodanese-related sulfurtransferase
MPAPVGGDRARAQRWATGARPATASLYLWAPVTHPFHAADVDIDPDRAKKLIEAGEVQLVDVREAYEWEAGRIAGARHIELERLASEAASLDRERPVLFYCRVGARSGMAASAFRRAGFDACSVDGGLTEWDRRGFPLEPEDGTVAAH